MNYYGAKNLADSWRTVRNNTIQVAEDIPADKYSFRAANDTMSVGEMLAHMATTTYWAMQVHFLDKKSAIGGEEFGRYFGESNAQASTLTDKDSIVSALKARGDDLARNLESASEEMMAENVALPGGSKTRFEMLLGLKEHEMHHRGQLMLIQRLLGIVPHLTRARQQRAAAQAAASTPAV